MASDFDALLGRLSIGRISALTGISLRSLLGFQTGKLVPGPRQSASLRDLNERLKDNVLRDVGVNIEERRRLVGKSWAYIESVQAGMDATIDRLTGDKWVPGRGITKAELRAKIRKNMLKSEKDVDDIFTS